MAEHDFIDEAWTVLFGANTIRTPIRKLLVVKCATALSEAYRRGMRNAYLAGFAASGEGWNGEYPFDDKNISPLDDDAWIETREEALATLFGSTPSKHEEDA